MQIVDLVADAIRRRGPLTVAAFMETALYHPELGYYARAAQRSGRAGHFFTSVDVGPLFGELLEIQIAEMAALLTTDPHRSSQAAQSTIASSEQVDGEDVVDLVEAGAGNGRLSADILRAARRRDPRLYRQIRLHLVEASAAARAAQPAILAETVERLESSSSSLPPSMEGILLANELLDALPVHQVVMRRDGLREVYVDLCDGRLTTREGRPSTPALAAYLDDLGIALEPGWRIEINLAALEWIRGAARRLRRGFVLLIDYGHEAQELYSAAHWSGTLTSFARHTMAGPEARADVPPWLRDPGEQDITAHVDFTSVRKAAEAEGLTSLALLDQTYFLLGLIGDTEGSRGSRGSRGSSGSPGSSGSDYPHPSNPSNLSNLSNPSDRRALKTLVMPGGLGSSHKVLLLAKGMGAPALRGCSYRVRVT